MDESNSQTPDVSVVIPTYNCAAYIADAIESVLAQSVSPAQLIVVDDGSTDETADAVLPYLGQIQYVRQRNEGVSAARNTGLLHADSPYVAFLDADDVWFPEKLDLQLAFLSAHPKVALVLSDFAIADADGTVCDPRYVKRNYPIFERYGLDWGNIFANKERISRDNLVLPPETDAKDIRAFWGDVFSFLYLGNFINTSSVVIKRDVLTEIGGFAPQRRTQEDYELWLKIALHSSMGYIDLPLLFSRRRPNQLTSQDEMESIVRVSLEVIEEFAPDARRLLGDSEVDQRLATKYQLLALVQLGQGQNQLARQSLRRSYSYHRTIRSLLLLVWSYVPSKLGARIRVIVRAFSHKRK